MGARSGRLNFFISIRLDLLPKHQRERESEKSEATIIPAEKKSQILQLKTFMWFQYLYEDLRNNNIVEIFGVRAPLCKIFVNPPDIYTYNII